MEARHVEKGRERKARTLDCPLGASHVASFPEEISLPEQKSGPRTTESLSWPHLCQECAVFAPDFDLTLIPWLVGDHSSGPFGGMIRMRE